MTDKITQATILAGGRGERLIPLTDSMPKPMAPINGVPFLDYLIYSIVRAGINNILILLGYKADVIVDRYNSMRDISIEFSYGSVNDQTGRRVLNAYDQLDDHFLFMYGDNYWPIELDAMSSNYQKLNASVTTTVFSNKNGTGEYGFDNNVKVGNDGMVIKYDKKRETDEANSIDIGYFLVAKKSLDPDLTGNISFEVDILPEFINKKQLGAYVTDTQYYYITNMQTLKDFENAAEENNFLPLPQNYFGA
jgi:D-glycero-alpha-D-manno-heptose 1-phosphate guanylyltransferase